MEKWICHEIGFVPSTNWTNNDFFKVKKHQFLVKKIIVTYWIHFYWWTKNNTKRQELMDFFMCDNPAFCLKWTKKVLVFEKHKFCKYFFKNVEPRWILLISFDFWIQCCAVLKKYFTNWKKKIRRMKNKVWIQTFYSILWVDWYTPIIMMMKLSYKKSPDYNYIFFSNVF